MLMKVILMVLYLGMFIMGGLVCSIFYEFKRIPELSASYEITVNEKTFKISDFKTKLDGSIEFTAEDGTKIHASTYEIRKLNQETDKTEEMKK